jgi:hypothetical protein
LAILSFIFQAAKLVKMEHWRNFLPLSFAHKAARSAYFLNLFKKWHAWMAFLSFIRYICGKPHVCVYKYEKNILYNNMLSCSCLGYLCPKQGCDEEDV